MNQVPVTVNGGFGRGFDRLLGASTPSSWAETPATASAAATIIAVITLIGFPSCPSCLSCLSCPSCPSRRRSSVAHPEVRSPLLVDVLAVVVAHKLHHLVAAHMPVRERVCARLLEHDR